MDEITERVEWAVRWTPGGSLMSTGSKPPWSADYARWKSAREATVYRKRVVTTVAVVESESEWEPVA